MADMRAILFLIAFPVMVHAQFSRKPLSHADSAAAIKSFMSTTGGSGFQYTWGVTSDWKIRGKDSVSRDTTSVSFTDSRNSCTDLSILGVKVRIVGHAATPLYSLWIYPQTRNYSLKVRDTATALTHDRQTYQVTKIGTETVSGYSCIHARLTTTGSRGKGSSVTQDIWTTTDIPGYSSIRQMMALETVTPGILRALEQAGCNGVIVKMTMQSSVISSSMILIRAAAANLPASLFELPSGYTPATTGGFFGGIL
jgi:Domain of unknown function (DUF4412)